MSGKHNLDCIIIGHNDLDFHSIENDLVRTQHYSGAYADLKMNTVDYHVERMPYMSLLNRVLDKATGVTCLDTPIYNKCPDIRRLRHS
jgi:hypothetical protein